MPIAAIMNTMTVTPTARPTLPLVLSVELDLGVELAVAAASLALALAGVVGIIAAAEIHEIVFDKENADDKDWVEDWDEDWDVLAVVVEVESVEVGCEDGRREPVPSIETPTTCKKANLRDKEGFGTFAKAFDPRIYHNPI